MKSKLPPIAVVFAASFAHVLLFLLGVIMLRLSDEAVIGILIILPALILGVYFGTTYGFLSLCYGAFYFFIYLIIGVLFLRERQSSAGAVILGWEVEAIFSSVIVLIANIVGAIPAAIIKSKRQ